MRRLRAPRILIGLAMVASLTTACAKKKSAGEPGGSRTPGDARTAMTCPKMLAYFGDVGTLTLTPGAWGTIPAQLKALPPGAEACGGGVPSGVTMHQVWVSSPLLGQPLADFYAPISAAMGCTQTLVNNVVGALNTWSLRISCSADNVLIGTDSSYQMYSITTL